MKGKKLVGKLVCVASSSIVDHQVAFGLHSVTVPVGVMGRITDHCTDGPDGADVWKLEFGYFSIWSSGFGWWIVPKER